MGLELLFTLRYGLALFIAIIADVLDYVGFFIFLIPIIGDIPDIAVSLILTALIGKFGLIGFAEIIPFVDVVPTFTIAVLLSAFLNSGRKGR